MQQSLMDKRKGLDDKIPRDLFALDISLCLQFLNELMGEIK